MCRRATSDSTEEHETIRLDSSQSYVMSIVDECYVRWQLENLSVITILFQLKKKLIKKSLLKFQPWMKHENF